MFGLIFVCMCLAPRPNEKRYRPEIWHTHLDHIYFFVFFFVKEPLVAAIFEKNVTSHGFSHISLIALFSKFSLLTFDANISQTNKQIEPRFHT